MTQRQTPCEIISVKFVSEIESTGREIFSFKNIKNKYF